MLCGRPPFEGDSEAAVALARLQRDPLRPRQVRPSVPRRSRRSCAGPWPASPTTATTAPPTCAPRCSRPAPSPAADVDGRRRRHATSAAAPTIPPPPQPRRARRRPRRPAPSFRQTERSWLVPTVILVVIALGPRRRRACSSAGRAPATSSAACRDAITGAGGPGADRADRRRTTSTPSATARESADQVRRRDRRRPGDGVDHRELRQPRHHGAQARRRPRARRRASAAELDELVAHEPHQRLVGAASTSPTATPATFEGWGEPVATLEGIEAGNAVEVDLGGAEGGAVLIWITDQGDGSGGDEVTIQEAVLSGVDRNSVARIRSEPDDPALVARRPGGRPRRPRRAAAPPPRPDPRGVPAAGRQRGRRARRHPGGADRHRPRASAASTAGPRSRPGPTGSPPTPASTSCAGASGGRCPACPTTLGDRRGRRHRRPSPIDVLPDRLAIDAALAELPEEFRAPVVLRDLATSTTPRSPRSSASRPARCGPASPAAGPSSPAPRSEPGEPARRRPGVLPPADRPPTAP